MIYAGQEFGEDTAKTVGPNPLNWKRTEGWFGRRARRLRDEARALVTLRTTHPALRTATVKMQEQGVPDGVAVYTRGDDGAAVVVAGNFGRRERRVTVSLPGAGPWRDVRGQKAVALHRSHTMTITLEPGAVAVFSTGQARAAAP
jgi:1,4-alpha-glucan branching enzyme